MSKRIIKITESQLNKIVNNITEDINNPNDMEEGLLDTIKQPFEKIRYGIKGLRGGYGYDYMAFTVELRNILRDLKKIDRPNEKVMMKLNDLKLKVLGSSMRPDLKDNLEDSINKAIQYFRMYANFVDRLTVTINQRLTNKTPSSTSTTTTQPTTASDYVQMVKNRGYRESYDFDELLKLGMKSRDINQALKGIPFKKVP